MDEEASATDDFVPLIESSGYRVEDLLGSGNFGRVYLCTRSDTLEAVAVKAIPKKDAEFVKDEVHNLELLQDLDPDKNGLIRFHGYTELLGNVFLEFEKLDMTLYDLVMTYNRPLFLSEIQAITVQMLMALEALRSIRMVHTDIKVDNIMLTEGGQRPLQAKLIDFGLAQDVSKLVLGEVLQALPYRAPEVILGLPLSEAMDMWALGTVIGSVYMEAELYSGDCELANMNDIMQLLGRPENHLLETGIYTKKYFDKDDDDSSWKLKAECTCSVQNSSAGSGFRSERCAVHPLLPDMMSEITCLEDIALTRPGTSANEDTRVFLSLLKEMLRVDPETRIQPRAALQHPFIAIKDFPSDSVSSGTQTPANTVSLPSSGDNPLSTASLSDEDYHDDRLRGIASSPVDRDETSESASPADSDDRLLARTSVGSFVDYSDQSLHITSLVSNSDKQPDAANSDDSNPLKTSLANSGDSLPETTVDRPLQHTSGDDNGDSPSQKASLASHDNRKAINVDSDRKQARINLADNIAEVSVANSINRSLQRAGSAERDNRSPATGRNDQRPRQKANLADADNRQAVKVSYSCNDAESSHKSNLDENTRAATASSTVSDYRSPQTLILDNSPTKVATEANSESRRPATASLEDRFLTKAILGTSNNGQVSTVSPTKSVGQSSLATSFVLEQDQVSIAVSTGADQLGRIRELWSVLMNRIYRFIWWLFGSEAAANTS